MAQFFWYGLTSSNINRFSNLFHCQYQKKMCNNTITKDPITPQISNVVCKIIFISYKSVRPFLWTVVHCRTRHSKLTKDKLSRVLPTFCSVTAFRKNRELSCCSDGGAMYSPVVLNNGVAL